MTFPTTQHIASHDVSPVQPYRRRSLVRNDDIDNEIQNDQSLDYTLHCRPHCTEADGAESSDCGKDSSSDDDEKEEEQEVKLNSTNQLKRTSVRRYRSDHSEQQNRKSCASPRRRYASLPHTRTHNVLRRSDRMLRSQNITTYSPPRSHRSLPSSRNRLLLESLQAALDTIVEADIQPIPSSNNTPLVSPSQGSRAIGKTEILKEVPPCHEKCKQRKSENSRSRSNSPHHMVVARIA